MRSFILSVLVVTVAFIPAASAECVATVCVVQTSDGWGDCENSGFAQNGIAGSAATPASQAGVTVATTCSSSPSSGSSRIVVYAFVSSLGYAPSERLDWNSYASERGCDMRVSGIGIGFVSLGCPLGEPPAVEQLPRVLP